MLKIKLKKSNKKESDFLYRFAIECLGRTVEFGLSHEELSQLREKSKSLSNYVRSLKKSATKARGLKGHTLKKATNQEKEVAVA